MDSVTSPIVYTPVATGSQNVFVKYSKVIKLVLMLVVLVLMSVGGFFFYKSVSDSRKKKPGPREFFGLKPHETTTQKIIQPNEYVGGTGDGYSFTMHFWIYVDGWHEDTRDRIKHIFTRGENPCKKSTEHIEEKDIVGCPAVYLDKYVNNLLIYLTTVHKVSNPMTHIKGGTLPPSEYKLVKCVIKNIPIREWVDIAVVIQKRSLSVYLRGELHQVISLMAPPAINQSPIYVGCDGANGMKGEISKLYYNGKAENSSEIYHKNQRGHVNSLLHKTMKKVTHIRKKTQVVKQDLLICQEVPTEVSEVHDTR